MKSDGGLRALFRARMGAAGHWVSIETGGTEQGVPDLNVCAVGGVECWIECKYVRRGWAVKFQPAQVGWALARVRRGGRSWIAVRRKVINGTLAVDDLYVYWGGRARELKEGGMRGTVPDGLWKGGPSGWDWDAVRALLIRSTVPTLR